LKQGQTIPQDIHQSSRSIFKGQHIRNKGKAGLISGNYIVINNPSSDINARGRVTKTLIKSDGQVCLLE
jgi:hypothetical protein